MKLDRTRELIQEGVDAQQPLNGLIHVLESALELVDLPDNDFCWSSWKDAQEAKAELESLVQLVRSGGTPDRLAVSVRFAPQGPFKRSASAADGQIHFLKLPRSTMKLKNSFGSPAANKSVERDVPKLRLGFPSPSAPAAPHVKR